MEGDAVESWLGRNGVQLKFALLTAAGAADVRGFVSFAQCPTDSGVHKRHVVRGVRRGASDHLVPARLLAPLTDRAKGPKRLLPRRPAPTRVAVAYLDGVYQAVSGGINLAVAGPEVS